MHGLGEGIVQEIVGGVRESLGDDFDCAGIVDIGGGDDGFQSDARMGIVDGATGERQGGV